MTRSEASLENEVAPFITVVLATGHGPVASVRVPMFAKERGGLVAGTGRGICDAFVSCIELANVVIVEAADCQIEVDIGRGISGSVEMT